MLHARSRPGFDGLRDGLINRRRALPVLQDRRKRDVKRQVDDHFTARYRKG